MAFVITLKNNKETKNSIRYAEAGGPNDPVGMNIYLGKEKLQAEFNSIPDTITVSIDVKGAKTGKS